MNEIKNLKKAAQRLKKAISHKERIILFGDSDLDGTTSVLLLEETLKNLGAQDLLVYFSEWESEDYGLNKVALQFLKPFAPALLVALDSGIGNFEEIKTAKTLGFSIIVIDHHEILGKIPAADIVVDPKQSGDHYPFKQLTTVCLVYQLSQILIGKEISSVLKQGFSELAALGIVADMMPGKDLNAELLRMGSNSIKETMRPGFSAIIRAADLTHNSPREIFQKLTAILNITAVKNHLTESYLLLKESSQEAALDLAKNLIRQAESRNQNIIQITEEISKRVENSSSPIIFEGDSQWPRVFSGAVASRICNKYKKPTFIFKKDIEKSRGSVRTAYGLNAVAALKTCSAFLTMYGGHPPAAGFTVNNENIDALKKCLEEYFKRNDD